MANAKKCDRCKNFFDKGTTFIKKSPEIFEAMLDYTKIGIHYENRNAMCEIDLCPRCAENLYEWLTCRDKLKD